MARIPTVGRSPIVGLGLAMLLAAALGAPALASTTLPFKATFAEPIGGPISSPFICPSDESCGSGEVVGLGHVTEAILFRGGCGGTCDLRTITFADGSTLVDEEFGGDHSVPGRSYLQPPISYGHPFDLTLTDVVDGGLSTGQFAGASGTLSGDVSLAGGMAIISLQGSVTLP